jgi:uncharacterized protein with HEPN domain
VPSKDPGHRFEDILTDIQRIEFHIASIPDETAFEENVTVYDAVERCLERISTEDCERQGSPQPAGRPEVRRGEKS